MYKNFKEKSRTEKTPASQERKTIYFLFKGRFTERSHRADFKVSRSQKDELNKPYWYTNLSQRDKTIE